MTTVISVAVLALGVAVLHQQPADDPAQVALAGVGAAPVAVQHDAGVRLARQRRQGRLVVAGREEHLDERPRQQLAERRRPPGG